MTFPIGTIVRLKSGGFAMTVRDTTPAGIVICYWHGADGISHNDRYPEASLRAVDERDITKLEDVKRIVSDWSNW